MNFQTKFDNPALLEFFKGFLPDDFIPHSETIPFKNLSFSPDRIKEIEFIGEVPSIDLKLYIFRHESEHDPRITLSRETFRIMRNLGARRALAAFYSDNSTNWRLSLATIDFAIKGARVHKEYSNPRRYSFFLGPDAKTHTPNQFLSKRVSDFEDLLKRFSIEVVNKEFYSEIAVKFTELVGGKRKVKTKVEDFKPVLHLPGIDMSKPESHITAQEFAVRLIGRIVFCWFLKKKKSPAGEPLLPESVLSCAAVASCDKAGDNYYHSVLENLFFQVLNTEISERDKEFKKAPYDKIPFLNGGLFEPHDDDFYGFDSITSCSKYLNTLKIPNNWFKSFFEILETYNFTIDENTSIDIELAVDPEMLGRIFENLLAEINPETGETARKSTGSYYTPRPIVEYMVDESLKEYLKTKTTIADEKLTNLLSYYESENDLSESEKEKVVSALNEVKILDPACGSGAFPMGMLQKIVLVLQKVDPDSKKWLSKLLDSVPDATARETLRKKLEGESDLWNYTRKLGIIRKSVYGVDIQPIAVELSKLRFFLSLVVDEKINEKQENRGIEPLPNLEFKFVCANTLIGLPKAIPEDKQSRSLDALKKEQKEISTEYIQKLNSRKLNLLEKNQIEDRLELLAKEIKKSEKVESLSQYNYIEYPEEIEKLKELRERYFISFGADKKIIEKQFIDLQRVMFLKVPHPDSQFMKLSTWEPFKNKTSSWFDPEWMFGIKNPSPSLEEENKSPLPLGERIKVRGGEGGFDIVIANPPYVSHDKITIKNEIQKNYESFEPFADLYCYFIEFGIKILAPSGNLCYITSNSYLRSDYGFPLRKLIQRDCLLKIIINIEDTQIFDAAIVNTAIINVQKKSDRAMPKCLIINTPYKQNENFRDFIEHSKFYYGQSDFSSKSWTLNLPGINKIKKKIEDAGKSLKALNTKIRLGLATGANEAFIVDENTKKELIKKDVKNTNIIKPILRGRDIFRYAYILSDLYILLTKNGVDVKADYPIIYKYLESFGPNFKNRGAQGQHWTNLRACAFFDDFKKEKIVWIELTDKGRFALCSDEIYLLNSAYFLLPPDSLSCKYLLAILNSKVIHFYLTLTAETSGMGTLRWINNYVKNFPVPEISVAEQKPFIDLVDKILSAKSKNPEADTSELENKIDQMVYKLYGLTEEEIKIVEGTN